MNKPLCDHCDGSGVVSGTGGLIPCSACGPIPPIPPIPNRTPMPKVQPPIEPEPELMDSCGDRATETGVALIDLRNEIRHARTLHTHPSFAALVEEVGEVATDIQDGKCTRAELIQVAAVAIRLATEPWGGE